MVICSISILQEARLFRKTHRLRDRHLPKLGFYVDYNIEVSEAGDGFKRESEQVLKELASSDSEMVGTAVALEKAADA